MTTDNICFYLQNRLIQTSQAGGQWYSETSPFSITCPNLPENIYFNTETCKLHTKSFYSIGPKSAESPMFKIKYLMSKILICKKGATTFSMTALCIMGLIETLRTNHVQHNDAYSISRRCTDCHMLSVAFICYAECRSAERRHAERGLNNLTTAKS